MPNKNQYKIGAAAYRRQYMPTYQEKNNKAYKTVGVYVWIAPDGIADYVGRGNLQRAKYHKYKLKRKNADNSWSWWTAKHTLVFMTCDNEWQAMEYEGKWGQRYLPRYNKDGYRYGSGGDK